MVRLRLALLAWIIFLVQCKQQGSTSATYDVGDSEPQPCTEVIDVTLQEVEL